MNGEIHLTSGVLTTKPSSVYLRLREEAARRGLLTLHSPTIATSKYKSFHEFVKDVRPSFIWYKHCEVLAENLEKVLTGEIDRLMIFMPPRSGKSEQVSRLFTAYYLYKFPDKWIGLNSYASDLAFTLSRAARENFIAAGGSISQSSKAVGHWQTTGLGGMWSAGVGGAITGKGFHVGLIDDPLKNAEEAASEVIREKQKEWYRSTFYTRAEPGAAIIIVQTLWNEDDLSGWLLSEEMQGENPERWHIVNLPALAEEPRQFPDTCTIEPDWRSNGEALCPERYDELKLAAIRSRIGAYYFNSLYQQRPSAREGSFFKVGNLEIEDAVPANLRYCRAWDKAASENSGNYTVGVKIGANPNGIYFITDMVRGQWSTDVRNSVIRQTAELDGKECKIHLPQDPGAAGKDSAVADMKLLAGFSVKVEPVSGSKEVRADPFSSQVNAGNVKLLSGPWNNDFISELRQFPTGKNDDIVDASSDSFSELCTMPTVYHVRMG